MNKIVAALGILIGGAGSIFALLVAFHVNITPDQWTAIVAVVSLSLTALGVFFHPATQLKLAKK
jgi:hypothetical protein